LAPARWVKTMKTPIIIMQHVLILGAFFVMSARALESSKTSMRPNSCKRAYALMFAAVKPLVD
jgi:hypothetical protein